MSTIEVLSIEAPIYSVLANNMVFTSTGVYTYSNEETQEFLNTDDFNLYQYINESSFLNLEGTTKILTYQGPAQSGGLMFTIKFTISLTNLNFSNYFKQFAYFNFFVRYTDANNNIPSSTNPKYFIIPINYSSANIAMTGNNLKTITNINMNSNKSIFLPNKNLCLGMVFHFKLNSLEETVYTFQLLPLLTAGLPTQFSFVSSLILECNIEGNERISLSGNGYKCISLVADSDNWRIINYYDGTLITNTSSTIPASTTVLTNPTKNIMYYRWDISGNLFANIHISSTNESNYKINFLSILNMYSTTNNSDTFRIYFPYEKSVDSISDTNKYTSIELSIAKHKLQSIIYTKDESGYIILGTTNYNGISVINYIRNKSCTLINRNVTILASVDSENDYEFKGTNSDLENSARIHILKIPRDDTKINTYNFNTPLIGNGNIIFNNSNATIIQLSGENSITPAKALWLSIHHESTGNKTIILPIHSFNGITSNIN